MKIATPSSYQAAAESLEMTVQTFSKANDLIYQLTNRDRLLPFMEGIDPENPLELAP